MRMPVKLSGTLAAIACALCLRADIAILSVTSGASFEPGLPPKGSIATIFCRGLVGIDSLVQASGIPLPFELAEVRVTVGGAPAPLFAVATGNGFQQINIQVPQEARMSENEPVEVRVLQGSQSSFTLAPKRTSSPGDFFRYGDGLGIFQHASDYSLVTESNPVKPGETIIAYLTGMIGTQPTVPTGQASPTDPLAVVLNLTSSSFRDDYTVSINVRDSVRSVVPSFMGLVPGLVGVYQINFRYPGPQEAGPSFFGSKLDIDLYRHYCDRLPPLLSNCRSPLTSFFSSRVKMWVGK